MSDERPDLGAMLYRLGRAVIAGEEPLLRDHDLPMWDYAVLSGLGHGSAPTQSELAVRVGRDRTRLIASLDRLEQQGLVTRSPDPRDRRNRIITLTGPGRERLRRCRTAIRAMETELLAGLDPADRETFLSVLRALDTDLGRH